MMNRLNNILIGLLWLLASTLGATFWFNTIYGYLYRYDVMREENEALRTQLADAQQSAREGIEASEENIRLRDEILRRGIPGDPVTRRMWGFKKYPR